MAGVEIVEEVEKKLTSRIPEEVYERLAQLAKEDRRSLNAELVVLLEEALEAREWLAQERLVAQEKLVAQEVEHGVPKGKMEGAQHWAAPQPPGRRVARGGLSS